MKKRRTLTLVGFALVLLMAALPASAQNWPIPGSGNTDVVVVNTNQDQGDPAVDVVALYYGTNGSLDYSRPKPIASRGSFAFLASDTNLRDGWIGSMILSSTDYELAAVAEITWTGGSSADGITAGAYLGYAFGSTEVYLPYAPSAPGAQFARIAVQNTEDSAANIQMEWINRDGVTDFTTTDTIDGLGSRTYDLSNPGSGGVPALTSTTFFNNNCPTGPASCFWNGGVKITSLNGRNIAAVVTDHWREYAFAYNGTSSGDTQLFIPSLARRFDAVQGWREQSIINAQCLDTSDCNVQIEFITAGETTPALTLNKTLLPGQALGANTRNGGDWTFDDFAVLGDTWVGSAIVKTTNNRQIAAVSSSIRRGTSTAGATSGVSVSTAGTETFLPAVYQSRESCPPGNDWTSFTLMRIQNPTAQNATDVDIYYYNRDGSLQTSELNYTIDAGKTLNRNTRVHCSDINLGAGWEGSVYIKSDVPLTVADETVYGGVKMNSYNGYSR